MVGVKVVVNVDWDTEGISAVVVDGDKEGLAAVVVVVVVALHLQGHVNILSARTDSDNSFLPLLGFIWWQTLPNNFLHEYQAYGVPLKTSHTKGICLHSTW